MAIFRRWLLILFLLALGGGSLLAAGSKKEERAYAAAVGAFNDGLYPHAETELIQFVADYPESSHAPEAVLLRAQAEMKQGKLADAITTLDDTNNLAKAGTLADEYVYWTGEAQFQNTNYPGAAETWMALAKQFPQSGLRLRAVVEASSAFTKLAEWRQVVALLEATNGVFQGTAQLNPENELVARGQLLLGQAKLALKDYAGASARLEPLLNSKTLKPELGRQAALLLYRAKLASGEAEAALAVTTNLLQIARLAGNDDWIAESVALRAEALVTLNQAAEALSAYAENLTNNAPAERQREAILKIAELAIAQKQFSVATNALGKYLLQFPDSPSADAALLTLGELHLQDYAASSDDARVTNRLAEAQAPFELFIKTFTNSPLLGKAYLDRGWCNWLAAKSAESSGDVKTAAQKIAESFDDFKTAARKIAAQQLPPSRDLLVAWFKMGDAQLAQTNFAGALENYRAVLEGLKISPGAGGALGDLAWYQILRTSLAMNDAESASNAFVQISQRSAAGELAQSGSLLYGESLASPAAARVLFTGLSSQLAGSSLQPQVSLAVARTYEREQNWPAAITNYENWLNDFPTNGLQPQVRYALALAEFQAGNETNAFAQFTNFVAQFPASELAPLAQWWVADYFFRAGDWVNAERNYKAIFQNPDWRNSPLVWQAQMMAGRAALARQGYPDAVRYFTGLTGDTNCPPDLSVSASIAYSSTLMLMSPAGTNNPLANFQTATNVLGQIAQANPTNQQGALAWFYIGECDVQLVNYDGATNAYAQLLNSPFASVSARSQAQIGLGIALEKKAALAGSDDQRALLRQALDSYQAVWDTRLDAGNDPFWVKKAGLQMLPLAGELGAVDLNKLIDDLEAMFPQLNELLEKKRMALPAEKK